jgi:hypothetical protein
VNEQRKCFHYTNLRPAWVANSIGLGARQCDLTVGCVRFGANGRDLDKSDLHPGPDVLQRHRWVAEHDYERWNERLGVERRFEWRQFEWRKFEWREFERASRRGRADLDPQRSMRRRLPHGCLGWLQLNGSPTHARCVTARPIP